MFVIIIIIAIAFFQGMTEFYVLYFDIAVGIFDSKCLSYVADCGCRAPTVRGVGQVNVKLTSKC